MDERQEQIRRHQDAIANGGYRLTETRTVTTTVTTSIEFVPLEAPRKPFPWTRCVEFLKSVWPLVVEHFKRHG